MISLPKTKKSLLLIALPALWLSSLSLSIVVIVALFIVDTGNIKRIANPKYSIYASKPLVLGAMSERLIGGDARAGAIDQFFASYNCPMNGLGKKFVEEADKNNIPFWIVPAIAFQESSCGKQTPLIDGQETYNAYGWGVWGPHVKGFDSWEHGIEIVSEYMNKRFFSQGITEPCEIMKIYTPPSKGSWCEGVNFFREKLTEYKTP